MIEQPKIYHSPKGVSILAKQAVCQKFVVKIRSGRLRKARWKLTLPMAEARRNDEIISLADSQVLRWIDEINGVVDADARAREIKAEIRRLRKEPNSISNKAAIRKLYAELDAVQFKPDYLCLIMDREKDYRRACKGFSINDVKYVRLLGTNGGIKNETIVFVSERIYPELKRRIDNGRDMSKPMVPAKLEAYQALTCSASIPVTTPNGVLIVPDCETRFLADTIYLNDEADGEPVMEYRNGVEVELNASDGYGLMSPELAERWSAELGLNYVTSGLNTRFAFEKGMVYTFDFRDFADRVSRSYVVKDAWGDEVDIRDVELIMTTSMVKLWDSYKSCEDYMSNCAANGYMFGVAKTCPQYLENSHTLNYQFIQSYQLSDDDIDRLIQPTIEEIEAVLGGDYRRTLLFLNGMGMTEQSVVNMKPSFKKALMIEPDLINDQYVRSCVFRAICNRIDEAKVGVLNVHGNYSMISGDPYALCQSIFGLPVTGLLKAGEIYNEYWSNIPSGSLACFRAPMTAHNNIRLVHPCRSDEARYWFRYLHTSTVLNAWDTACHALNGCDFDGDLVMLTDNPVLVERLMPSPAIMCVQRKAAKKLVTEEDIIQSNINSFGDEIGKTTNWITSMFEVRSHFEPGSTEYKTLDYRIKCGQLFQQNVIDKAKGIIAKPMPRSWHDRHAAAQIEDEERRRLYLSIAADKKPYFMRYIYPALSKDYNTYIKNTNKSALREFKLTVDEMYAIAPEERTERQAEFLYHYERRMPVGTGDCVMNRICRKIEERFDGYLRMPPKNGSFDYEILKSGALYTDSQFYAVQRLYREYNRKVAAFSVFASYERLDQDAAVDQLARMREEFMRECSGICSNAATLCDIVLDICYKRSNTRRFAWDICAEEIVENLLRRRGGRFSFPMHDAGGDITYCGEKFIMTPVVMEVDE